MINRLLADLDKTVEILHDNTEVKTEQCGSPGKQFHSVASSWQDSGQ